MPKRLCNSKMLDNSEIALRKFDLIIIFQLWSHWRFLIIRIKTWQSYIQPFLNSEASQRTEHHSQIDGNFGYNWAITIIDTELRLYDEE